MSNFDITKHAMVGDNILVEAIVEVAKSKKGLVDPTQYDDKPEWGKVLSVGPGRYSETGQLIPQSVSVGDIITFGKYSSYKSRINGKDYLIIRNDDVMSKAK